MTVHYSFAWGTELGPRQLYQDGESQLYKRRQQVEGTSAVEPSGQVRAKWSFQCGQSYWSLFVVD